MHRLWSGMLRLGGWRVSGEVPPLPKMVIVGAPHTSNWDFVIGMLAARALRIRIRFLGKHTLFRKPFGWFFRFLGGIPVYRTKASGVISQSAAAFDAEEELRLIVAPEGTRRAAPHWKSGFYEIARAAGVPLLLVALDGKAKEVRVGPVVRLSGAVTADMDRIRTFYAGVHGVKKGGEGPVRLRSED